MKFVCQNHPQTELEVRTKNQRNEVSVSPCPICYKEVRGYGKQFALNKISQGLAEMIKEKPKPDDKDEEEEEDE